MSLMRNLVVALSCLLVVPAAVACNKTEGPKVATVKAGEMPVGGEWSGVYFDPFYGNLHLIVEGSTANGRWRKASGDSWGELAGEVDGNLLKYEWTEHRIGMVGASAQTTGKGYFVYKQAKVENDPDFIEGERGIGEDETGQKWKGIKQSNMVPDLDSVMPDEIEGRGVTSGWDDEGKAKGGEKDSGGEGWGDAGGDESEPSTGDDGDTDY